METHVTRIVMPLSTKEAFDDARFISLDQLICCRKN